MSHATMACGPWPYEPWPCALALHGAHVLLALGYKLRAN